MESSAMFYYARNEKLEETINILKEGLRESEALKTEWEAILNTVDTVDSLDRLKELLLLAYHYRDLCFRFKSVDRRIIEQFIENPYNEIFTNSSNQWIIANCTQKYPFIVRRFRHLNPYVTSVKEKYYNVFKFENVSFDSPDMMYGSALLNSLLHGNEFLKSVVVRIMKHVIDLTMQHENIVALYNLVFKVYNIDIQFGGGSVKNSSESHKLLVNIGDYVVANMTCPASAIHFKVADDLPICMSTSTCGVKIINYLIYQKNIIPRDYLAYVTEMNEEYEREGEEGPYHEIKEFLKRRMQIKKPKNAKKTLRNSVRKQHVFSIQKPTIKTKRRRKQ